MQNAEFKKYEWPVVAEVGPLVWVPALLLVTAVVTVLWHLLGFC